MNEDGRSDSSIETLDNLSLSEGDSSEQKTLPIILDKPTSPSPSEESGSCGDGDSGSSSRSSTPIHKAPVELLGEFLLYVRKGNWEDAKKLCKMILIYEPDNPEAKSFLPLIEEKIQIDKELAALSEDEEASSVEEGAGDSSSAASASSGAEEERGKTGGDDEEEEDSDDESESEARKTEHLKNKLLFSHKDGESSKFWKP